jgi:rubredoxin
MNAYRTPAPFTCPECGAQHDRGWVDGVETYRCLGCGYVGTDNRPRPPEPLTDEEFKSKYTDVTRGLAGPFFVNPMVIARIRKVFMSDYDVLLIPRGAFVAKLWGCELYQTTFIPDGWLYAPIGVGGLPNVLRGGQADQRYLHQLDPTAEPYVAPQPIPSRYNILMRDDG